jgi:hypothetical protein
MESQKRKEYKRRWYQENKERIKLGQKILDRSRYRRAIKKFKEKNKKYYTKNRAKIIAKRYNITEQEYHDLALEASGKCCLCMQATDKLRIDHDHKTGKVRKLIVILVT